MPELARWGIAVAVGAVLLGGAVAARPADHPTLVTDDSTACRSCHEELLAPRVVHAPVREDCSACHEVTMRESGTTMALVDTEPALCVMCHDDLAVAVEAGLATPHFPVTDSCLICHEPHSGEHDRLLLGPPAEICGECHDAADINEIHGGQLTTATNCAACHEPHGSANDGMLVGTHQHRPFADGSCDGCHREPFGERLRLRSRNEKLCTACHTELANPGAKGGVVHAALEGERGKAGCLSCHDPHMSRHPKLLVDSGPELCGRCHDSLVEQATAETGHYPAGDDCLNCHLPHVSERAALLTESKDDLCRLCHDVEDSDLVASHLGANLAGLDCLTCHTPHGSGHESLLAENLHPPLEAGCEICHEGAYDELLEDGDSPLCLLCHEEIQQIADEAETPHGALDVARCADCHNPHASPQAKLVKAPDGEICTECHDEKKAGPDEVAHGVIGLIGCQACHEPHGGQRPKLLRAEGDLLCRSCHDPAVVNAPRDAAEVLVLDHFSVTAEQFDAIAKLRLSSDGRVGHPVANHQVSGVPTGKGLRQVETTFEGELSCLTCHDPHKGRSKRLFRWNAASTQEACQQCHPK